MIANVAADHTFIHQNVTTYHPLAQRFAKHMLKAQSLGFIFDYSSNEALRSYSHADGPMSALVMTTALRASPAQHITLPQGPWGQWLADLYSRLPMTRQVSQCSAPSTDDTARVDHSDWVCFETNPALALLRRVMKQEAPPQTGPVGLLVGPRVDLVHVPLSGALHVGAAFAHMQASGFLPVALRPHATRADEVVFQRINVVSAGDAVSRAKFADPKDAAMMQRWLSTAASTSA